MASPKILCPIDFSQGSQRALAVAARLATERAAELVVLHAWYLPPVAFAGGYVYPPETFQRVADDARRELDDQVREATRLGVQRVTSQLADGPPWRAIIDAVDADPAFELIVIGTHGQSAVTRVLLGSVTEAVVRHAPCPVLVIRPDGEPAPYHHALCPVDFSPASLDAMELAGRLVQPGGRGISLLHVVEPPAAWGELRPFDVDHALHRGAAAQLSAWAKELAGKLPIAVSSRVCVGRAGSQLLAALDDDRTIDLVVMGSHGRTGLARMVIGSVAEKVVRHARCAVMVAHQRTP